MNNRKAPSGEELHKALFVNLVMMLSSSAMQQLGKLANPMTNQTEEVNLEGARLTIDMLEMVKAKTEGNRDAEEEELLSSTLASLQMTYVETAREQPAQPKQHRHEAASKPSPQGRTTAEEGGEADSARAPDDKGEARQPRYHKSYGE